MTIEDALYSRLSTATGVSALVSDRIYPMLLTQTETMPAIVYQRITTTKESAMSADTGISRPVYQVTSWAKTFAGVRALAEAVRAALQRWRGTEASVTIQATYITNDIDLYDSETKLFQTIQDYEINHLE